MISKTSRAYVTSEQRIAKIDAIPVVGTVRVTGAKAKYMTKDDFPPLAGLAEGEFAKDIYLKKDEQRKRVIIPDDNAEQDYYGPFAAGKLNNEDAEMGILDSGKANEQKPASALAVLGNDDKVIFWYNGVWSIINRHEKNSKILIPVELAQRVISGANRNTASVMASLEKERPENSTYECVDAERLAQLIDMDDLYSQWEFDETINVMMNTAMINGPYKLQRENNQIYIRFSIDFENCNNRTSGYSQIYISDIDHGIENITAYQEAIKDSFREWSGSYNQEAGIAEFGYESVTVTVDVDCKYEKSAKVKIMNSLLWDKQTEHPRHAPNVYTQDGNWSISKVGVMTLYNHYEDKDGNVDENLSKWKYQIYATHEFGHFIGLGDAYNGALETQEVDSDDIMWKGSYISPNDIEMAFLAVLKNEKQYFYSSAGKIVSDAISMREEG